MSLDISCKQVEVVPVGRSFLIHYLKTLEFYNQQRLLNEDGYDANDADESAGNANNVGKKKKQKKKKNKVKQEIEVTIDWDCDLDDYYALLGIKKYQMTNLSVDSLKKAYRKVSLLCHPDKVEESHRKQAESRFKLLQTAFDELSDPYMKLMYDSKIDFDPSIPSVDMVARLGQKRIKTNSNDTNDNPNNKTNAQMKFEQDYGNIKDLIDPDHQVWTESEDFADDIDTFLKSGIVQNKDDMYGDDVGSGANILETRFVFYQKIIKCGNEQEFYKLFEPYFAKYSIYSKKQPVPKFGNEDSSMTSVQKFYNFWFQFDSWRLFLHIVRENGHIFEAREILEAENNRERKWMIKENNKMQERYKKEESMNVHNMVMMAYQHDPRVTRYMVINKINFIENARIEEEKRLEKQRLIEEKELAEHMKKQEAKRKKIEAEKQAAKLEAQQRREARELPIRFRELCNHEYFQKVRKIKSDDIDTVVFNCNLSDIKEILTIKDGIEAQYLKYLEKLEIGKKNNVLKKEQLKAKEKLKKEKSKETSGGWTMDDINLLWTAVGRYPGGTLDRWTKITAMFNGKRSQDEVIKKVKELTKKQRNKGNKGNKAGKSSKLSKSSKSGKSKDKSEKSEKSDNKSSKSEKKQKDKDKEKDKNDWSGEDQKKLEGALRQVRSLPAAEKWDKVAEIVGKSKEDCMERFKYIRAQLLAKQKAAAAAAAQKK